MAGFRWLALGIMLWTALIVAQPASAHANLARSEPEANAVLDESPTRLRLWFTERPEVRFSVIQLLNERGAVIPGLGTIQVDSADPNLLIVSLPTLPPGVYTVNWRVLSAVDGHTTVGGYAFAVGRDQAAGGAVKPFIASSLGETSTPTVPGVAVRWISYLSMALLVGGFAFVPLVYRPALVGGKQAQKSGRPAAAVSSSKPGNSAAFSESSGLLLLLQISYAVLCLTTLAAAFVQAGSAQIDLVGLLTATRYGAIFWLRAGLLAGLGGLILFRKSRRWQPRWAMRFWWAGLGLNGAILLTTSLGSHAAAVADPVIPVIADWLHLATAGTWIGGLATLLLTLRWLWRADRSKSARDMAALVSRFSQVATICITLISVSGIFRAVYEIGDIANLIDTPYGVALLAKLGLMLPIFGAAALNLLTIEHRMRMAATKDTDGSKVQPWYRLLRCTVGTEITFVTLVLLATGLLTSLAPAREAFGAGQVVRGQVDDLRILVAVNPGIPGLNTFDIYLKDSLNRPIPDPRRVALYLTMTSHEMGIQEAVAERVVQGHYAVRGGYASMIGVWKIEVLVRRDGLDDSRLALKLPLLSLTRRPATLALISPSSLLISLELFAFGVILLFGARRLGRGRPKVDFLAHVAAGAALALSLVVGLTAFSAGENGMLALRNPIPPDSASLARGQKLYQDNCLACHGATGAGDGPLGLALRPQPANLQTHMTDGHPDGLLFDWVTNGVQGTAMPAFGARLSERERWDVINFIRTFARP